MDPKHKELLDRWHQNLLESITDVDRLLEVLAAGGSLSQAELRELEKRCSTSAEKVDLLLKTLVGKEKDHFQDLCAALEKTHPRLYSTLSVNGAGLLDHPTGSTYSALSAMPSDSESSSSLGSLVSSPPPAHPEKPMVSEKLDVVVLQLRQVTRERDDLRKRLALSSPGTTFDDCRPTVKAAHDYERLKLQCMKAMADLQALQTQHTHTLKRCQEAMKEADFYHTLHGRALGEQAGLRAELEALRRDYTQLLDTCEGLRRVHDDDQKEVADMRLQQQQALRDTGASDVVGKLYDTAMEKLDALRREYDSLRSRYGEEAAGRGADARRLQQLEEENAGLQKQLEVLVKQREASSPYPQLHSAQRVEAVQQELGKACAQNVELQREVERLQSESTRYKSLQLRAVQEGQRVREERDSVLSEYRLVMSERDQVIKEVERLQTGLEASEAKLKGSSSEQREAVGQLEALRQELSVALLDRDRAICERAELLDRYSHEVQHKAEAQKELSQACKDIETALEERDVARKERTEAIIQRDQLLCDYYQAKQQQDSVTVDMERVSKEMDALRKQCEAATQELKEAVQEAEVAKCRRDWAFQERDKIVAERESIRTLCDNLRRERDRAVSDLADALRNLDDMRKHKNELSRELKELKERLEEERDKETHYQPLMAHNSHDSAIDTDSLEWETEVVELERVREDMDLKALGFDVAEGVNDPYLPGDCGVFVTKVDKGSVADGRLRVNDWLLKINDVDLANKDKKQVMKAVLGGSGVINMVVRRRRSLGGKMVTPIHLNLSGSKESGVVLEGGVFVASVSAGSPAAREACVCAGDRLIAINGIAVDNKSLSECEALLRSCRESLSLSVMKSVGGVTLGEGVREYEPGCNVKVPPLEAYMRNCRNQMLSSSETQSSQQGAPCSTEPFHELCFQRPDPAKRPLTFHPVASGDCLTMETVLDKRGVPQKLSGGTWPKIMAMPDNAPPLSIFKTKKRKSIFDSDLYKRPETPSKLDYVSLVHIPKHSTQTSRPEGVPQCPPEPPKRSDSFKFKHKQQGSSASDSTITTGTPPATPIQTTPSLSPGGRSDLGVEGLDRNGNLLQRQNSGDARPSTPRRICDEEVMRQGADELEMRKARLSSAPTRCALTSLQIPIPLKTPEEACADGADGVPVCSPDRSKKHSMNAFLPGHAPSTVSPTYPPSRGLSPCLAFTTVMRKPIYTAWSHWINTNSPPPPAHQHTAHNVQHQGRRSLDLSHNSSSELSDPPRSRVQHNTHSLPSSARQGLSQYRAERIKIPPTPRYTRSSQGSDRGSHSEGSSPSLVTPPLSPLSLDAASFTSSQSQSSLSTQPRLSVSPAPIGDRRKERRGCVSAPPLSLRSSPPLQLFPSLSCACSIRSARPRLRNKSYGKLPRAARVRFCSLWNLRPYIEEPRCVTIPKGAEPLGISIVGGENGGIFVSKVTGGSIAQRHHLEFGDQLLEFNGINLRNATEQQARLIIGQQCDIITILAQYNPHMYQPGNHSHCSSRMESVSARSTPVGSGGGTPDICSTVDTLCEQEERTPTPPSKHTPTTRSSLWGCSEGGRQVEPRHVTVKKTHVDLGVKICGGNLSGIYVESVAEDSPAGGADGLQPGDLILQLCSVSMRRKTAEEAYMELLKPADTVTFRVQKRPDDWRRIRNAPGDGFYVRALFDRVGESVQELSFKKDDILYVDDTLPDGNFGYWLAWQLDENGQKLCQGRVPSKYMLEHRPRRCSGTEGKDDEGQTVSAAARRSFFRRRHKHKRSGSRDGRDGPAPDSISTDSIPYTEDCVSLAYQRVQKVESTSRRPVLILGPLVEPIKDMLVREAPGKYCRCLLEVMKASQQAIERGVKDCLFIDYKRRSGHFDVTTVASIKEIIEKDCHCLIDIAPHAIERLHSVSIYPIIIFIRYKNAKQIKEQKDPVYLRDKVSQKHSKEQFEAAQKMEQEYSKYFTGVVHGGSLSSICTQVMAIVEHEQTKALWLPDASV
ncbi:disks large homolog 5 isoform X2 [Brachyhypopomus gauderio]|uniref:disks large homolog 5 isoform X2 n=1 Tax=Brachyhypopomus gauderio TaxID=698409 RepID=UPI004042164E